MPPVKSTWSDTLQPSQRTPALAERAARQWLARSGGSLPLKQT
eukprot:CAMPEP_0174746864 /NCGR_PEP_ID=MMETSP1094-20130205/89993_1 /TAXON_ID=156173 /ORGANISM="Chrysochromulina brevifilum, Strain UTEX LB 985" /LENGTH=42 /DNA_ID= /DNA_START= /DNA_END= /DNA_ORIENTATION=